MINFNKFNKIKEVIAELLEKSIDQETTHEILIKDVKVVFSYVKFSLDKRVEQLIVGLNKIEDEKKAEIEMDYADLSDLRFLLKIIFADISYDLLNGDKDCQEKYEIINDFKSDIDTLIIKILNKLSPMHLVLEDNFVMKNSRYEETQLKFG